MSQNSAIEWTEATWNPVRGCVKVSPGCAHCYAETFAERWRGIPGHAYEQGFDLRLVPEKLSEPLRIKKPTTFFVNSMSDLFQEGVPFDYIDRVFAVMALSGQHMFQVLTKRSERMREYMTSRAKSATFWKSAAPLGWTLDDFHGIKMVPFPLPNVWLGVSVENQHFADERIPLLLQTPAAVRFISAEPLLGAVNLADYLEGAEDHGIDWKRGRAGACVAWTPPLDWVIVGGESGPGARPFNVEWARQIVAQCRAAGVSVFVKQLGADPYEPYSDSTRFVDLKLKSRKGGDMAEWPEDLRVREMPTQTTAHIQG